MTRHRPDGTFDLTGKRAVVTGGSRGIGAGIASGLVDAGASVALIARSNDVNEVAAALGGAENGIYAVRTDLGARDDLAAGFSSAVGLLGGVDILVNSHGTVHVSSAEEHSADDWDRVIETNLTATFRLCQLAAGPMLDQRHGKIVNIASMYAFFGGLRVAAYTASKGGLAQLTRALSNEWAPRGINVNAIAPGYVRTDLNRHIWSDPNRSSDVLGRIPAGRWGEPEDLAGLRGVPRLARVRLPAWSHPPGRRRFSVPMTPNPLVGVDSFAYHRWFGEWNTWESPLGTKWTTIDFLDRAGELGCDIVSLQTCYLGEMDRVSMRRLAAEASECNLELVLAWGHRDGLRGGRSRERFESAMETLEAGSDVGVGLLRVVCGDQTYFAHPVAERVDRLVPMLDALARRAADLGMAIAVENHADFTAEQLSGLVDRVGDPNLGICFDVGNAVRVGDDPVGAARMVATRTRMVHVKDMLVQDESRGDPCAWWPTVPLGSGDLPVGQILGELSASRHQPSILVEMANMHPSSPDEDSAVVSSIEFLRRLFRG